MNQIVSELEPIAGVSLASFVNVSLELARVQFDASRSTEVAGELGIAPAAWSEASEGWSRRLRESPVVADEFARRYRRGWGAA